MVASARLWGAPARYSRVAVFADESFASRLASVPAACLPCAVLAQNAPKECAALNTQYTTGTPFLPPV